MGGGGRGRNRELIKRKTSGNERVEYTSSSLQMAYCVQTMKHMKSFWTDIE